MDGALEKTPRQILVPLHPLHAAALMLTVNEVSSCARRQHPRPDPSRGSVAKVGGGAQLSRGVVDPVVVGAHDAPPALAGLPDELVAAVTAAVLESTNLTVDVPNEEERMTRHRRRVVRFRDLVGAPDFRISGPPASKG